MRRLALLVLSLSLFAVPATANAAVAGGLKQLSGGSGCLSGDSPAPTGCSGVRGLQSVFDVVVSPDGRNAYASSPTLDAIVAFARNTSNGVLTQKSTITGCITSNATTASTAGCNLVPDANALDGVGPLAISPDGESVYSVNEAADIQSSNNGIITALNRATDGTLTFNETNTCCFTSGAAVAITVSPDGKSVYAVGPWFNGMVEWLRRVTDAGANHGDISNGAFYQGPGTPIQNLGSNPNDIVVSPDGKEVFISTANNVLGWDRNTTTDVGRLAPATAANRCVTGSGTGNPAGTCQTRAGILSAQSLAAPNNSVVYAGAQQALTKIDRNASTGALTPDTARNCFGYPTSTFAGCTAMPGSTPFVWYPQHALAASPDGQNLYFGNQASPAGIFGYTRSGNNIARNSSGTGCTNTTATEGCTTFRQGNQVQQLAVSPNSRNVYAVGNNRLFTFAIDRPPTCATVSASTSNTAAVRVGFKCSDPDGDVLTFQKVTDPSRGALAAISGAGVSYVPFPGTSGTDSFRYRAVAGGAVSDPATAFVNVSSPPPPPPPPPTVVVPSTTTINSLAFPKFTKLLALAAKNLPANSKVVVTCKTKKKKKQKKGCPYKKKTFTSAKKKTRLDLRKPYKKKKLPVGTKIGITINANGFLGKRITYTTRAGKLPKSKVQCLTASGRVGKCR